MAIFSGLDRAQSAEASAIRAARRAKPSQNYGDLVYLAGLGDDHLESRLGLRESAQLVLQIFKTAQVRLSQTLIRRLLLNEMVFLAWIECENTSAAMCRHCRTVLLLAERRRWRREWAGD